MLFVRKEIALFIKRTKVSPKSFSLRGDTLYCSETGAYLEMNNPDGDRVYRFAGRGANMLGWFVRRALKKAFKNFKKAAGDSSYNDWLASLNPPSLKNE